MVPAIGFSSDPFPLNIFEEILLFQSPLAIRECNHWQRLTLRRCPLIYYNCNGNLNPKLAKENLLTSGYSENQYDEFGRSIQKPSSEGIKKSGLGRKCSHGGIFDGSSHNVAVG
ncbi:hypothetical protein ACOME3_007514 [Neoechinorhynchus agilis]